MPILARGNLELALMPEAGGCIARFAAAHDGGVQQMLRPLPAGIAAPGPLDMACYPLVPFSGRITNGRLPLPAAPCNCRPTTSARRMRSTAAAGNRHGGDRRR